MVSPVHHATLAKANKLGFTVFGDHGDDFYTVQWPERNKRFQHRSPVQGVEDMRIVKMITLEYPQLVPVYDVDGERWSVCHKIKGQKHPEQLASATVLEDAFDLALAELADRHAKVKGGNRKALRDSLEQERALETEGDDISDEEAEQIERDEQVKDEILGGADEPALKTIVKPKYKAIYKANGGNNGDEFALKLNEILKVKDPDTGKLVTDRARLIKWARLNQLWDPKYEALSTGQMRMSCGNKARAKGFTNLKWDI